MTPTPPTVVYITPASSLHGGVRVIFEHAEGLVDRGYGVTVVGPEPAPDWHSFRVPYRQVEVGAPGAVPAADIVIGTFWTTLEPACAAGGGTVFHFCQGFEGVHREYAPVLDRIDAIYRLPVPKLLISGAPRAHPPAALRRALPRPRPGDRQPICSIQRTGQRSATGALRIGIVGSFGVRSKGIREALEGIALARRHGVEVVVERASAEPFSEAERALGVVDRYHHRLSTEEMPGFYRGLDLLIHPSYDEEGFPLPPLEAMACGVPAAVSAIGYTRSLPEDAVHRFEPGEPAAVAEALETLRDPRRRAALAGAGLACARRHTLDRVLDRLEAAFAAEGAPRSLGEPHAFDQAASPK